MAATVQIAVYPAAETHDEGGFLAAIALKHEALTASAVDQFIAAANPALRQGCCRNHAASSATLAAQNKGACASRVARGCAP